MDKIIEKYEDKLDFLTKALDDSRHFLGEEKLDIMNNLKILLTEIITDLKAIKELTNK